MTELPVTGQMDHGLRQRLWVFRLDAEPARRFLDQPPDFAPGIHRGDQWPGGA